MISDRIVIVGGPRTGKTSISKTLGIGRIRPTDALIETHQWSEVSEEVARWFDEPGRWVIEGTATVRALRKWLARAVEAEKATDYPQAKPCDLVIRTGLPCVELSDGQARMAKAVETIWLEVREELERRGVLVVGTELRAFVAPVDTAERS